MRDNRERFVDLANKRVSSAIDKMRLIGNLSDKRFYEYSDGDVKQIVSALSKELETIKLKFKDSEEKKEKKFRLKG